MPGDGAAGGNRRGRRFLGLRGRRRLLGVMGRQALTEVTLIRHAYV